HLTQHLRVSPQLLGAQTMPSSHWSNESRRIIATVVWLAFASEVAISPPRRRSRYGVNRKFVAHRRYYVRGYQIAESDKASGSDIQLVPRTCSMDARFDIEPGPQHCLQKVLCVPSETT